MNLVSKLWEFLNMTGEHESIDKVITITPRTLMFLAGSLMTGTILGYFWLMTTFVTLPTFNAHADDFKAHTAATTIWQLETRLQDIGDQRWLLKQRMEQPGGDNQDNRLRDRELQKREKIIEGQIRCVREDGKYCLNKPS